MIYLYGIIPVQEAVKEVLPTLKGLDDKSQIRFLELKETVAVVCHLDGKAYTKELILDKTNHDMEWLQEKAFHHHETLLALHKRFTVIPMKFCTLFSSEDSLREAILQKEDNLLRIFVTIKENEEWNLKIYCDDERIKQHVMAQNPVVLDHQEEIGKMSPGKQFFEKRKMEKIMEQEMEKEKQAVCEQLHERLVEFSLLNQVKRNWKKEVTGRRESMSWNSVYLVSGAKVNEFHEQIRSLKEDILSEGWTLEATGPWPAYHFASLN